MTDHCACVALPRCQVHLDDFYMCISDKMGDFAGCASTFATQSNDQDAGAGPAPDLSTCMQDCQDICQGKDAGPRL
jgi:hypothetical protein